MARPNFFVVGAPKCGTTALYTYLRAHPDIFMPLHKEPNHFNIDLVSPRFERFRSREVYLSLFEKATTERRIGEASIYYLYSQRAAQEIKDFNPDSRIIIMIRSPVEMLRSLYDQHVFSGQEDISDFAGALAAEEQRRRGERIPPNLQVPVECLLYRDIARYADQIQRYLDAFGRDAVRVIIFDDFKADVARVYGQILKFLDVDPDFRTDFQIVNPRKQVRHAALRDFLVNPPGWYRQLRGLGRTLLPEEIRQPVTRFIYRLNTQPMERLPVDPDLRAHLQREFLPEIERLSDLLARDLTNWCSPV